MSQALPAPRMLTGGLPKSGDGGKPDKLVRDAIILDLHRLAGKGKTRKLYAVASRLVDMAIEGDLGAIKEVLDRVDGRVPQEQRIAGADGGALMLQVEDSRPRIDQAVLGLLLAATTDVDTAPQTIEHDALSEPDAS